MLELTPVGEGGKVVRVSMVVGFEFEYSGQPTERVVLGDGDLGVDSGLRWGNVYFASVSEARQALGKVEEGGDLVRLYTSGGVTTASRLTFRAGEWTNGARDELCLEIPEGDKGLEMAGIRIRRVMGD